MSCEVGFEGGCMMCECEPDECPEIETPICQAGERLFCTGLEPLERQLSPRVLLRADRVSADRAAGSVSFGRS